MNPLPRRSSPGFHRVFPFRTRTGSTPQHIPRKFSLWKKLALLLFFVVFAAGGGWFLTRTPREYECLTDINTICPPQLEELFSALETTPLWRIQKKHQELKAQALGIPSFVESTVQVSPLQKVTVKIRLAEQVFPFMAEGKNWILLSNGTSVEGGESSLPQIELTSPQQAEELTPEERQALQTLYQRARVFSPRIRKIRFLSSQQVEVYPENHGKVLFTLTNVDRQMSTLQAFFRSTTIDQAYQVLDVRFTDVAVIKE